MSKIILSGRSLGKTLGNLGKNVLLDFVVPLAKDVYPKFVTKGTSPVLDKKKKKINGKGAVRVGR